MTIEHRLEIKMRRVDLGNREHIEYLGLEDMPPCRACGCAPVVKTTSSGDGSMRIQCPECGIRTGMSTNEQASFERWAKAMAGGTVYCPLEHAWIDECPDECDTCPGTGA